MPDYRAINTLLDRCERWLIAINVLLTVLLLATLAMGGLRLPGLGAVPGEAAANTAPEVMPQGIDKSEVSERTRGRAPFRTGRVKEVKEIDELGSFRLIGASSRGDSRKAYVRDLKQEKVVIKQVGDQLGSYEIIGIEKQELLLRKGSEDFVLRK